MPKKRIEDLESILQEIKNSFKNNFFKMDFIFLYTIDKKKYVSSIVRGRPFFNIKAEDNNVYFDSSETFNMGTREVDWKRSPYPKYSSSQMFFAIDDVSCIQIYNWGFEILGKNHCLWSIDQRFIDNLYLGLKDVLCSNVNKNDFLSSDKEQVLKYEWDSKIDDEFEKLINGNKEEVIYKSISIEEEL